MARPNHQLLHCLVTALALLISASANASSMSIDVQIAPPRSRFVERRDLRSYCNTGRDIYGCTVLLGPRLTTSCAREENGYRLRASAQIVPYVYFTSEEIQRHEQAHLDDLRAQIETWFADLAARNFGSAEECRAVGDFESAVFALRMDMFRRKSNERLH